MADFASLATSYVLADAEDEQQRLAGQAAEAIKSAPRKSAAVLGWAQSINQWMPNGDNDADSDVIVRAKALGFLASTLEVLDKDVLRVEQVEHLIAFFGALFAIDHKAGVLDASTALRCLCTMTQFRPPMANAVLSHLNKLGEDFRLQVPATRRAVYDLIALLVRNDAALKSLSETNGASGQFLIDLLQLCRHERDPDNLLRWFAILRHVLDHYGPPALAPNVVEEVFKVASDYFPISMRSSATAAGTTVDDLKTALRSVFSASSLAAAPVFDFLLQKMDQGDALTVSVKVDILSTIHACIAAFPNPAQTVVPHTSRIWNSLKYEVRHGDVPETIDGTLQVIQAISTRLCRGRSSVSGKAPAEDAAFLKDFVDLVLADCTSDLSNSTFTTPAGRLLTSTMLGGFGAYNLMISSVIGTVKKDLQQAQAANHTRDLVGVLNLVLRTRHSLIVATDAEAPTTAASPTATETEFQTHDDALVGLLESVYLRLWNNTLKDTAAEPTSQEPVVLTEVIRGLAALIAQRGPRPASPSSSSTPSSSTTASRPLLCTHTQCERIFEALAPRILVPYSSASQSGAADEGLSQTEFLTIAHEAMTALQTATAVYPEGFTFLVERTVSSIAGSPSGPIASYSLIALSSSAESLSSLRDTLSRVAYIGCSTIPSAAEGLERSSKALFHFLTLTQALFTTLERLLDAKASFQATNAVLSGVYGAALNLRDAFSKRGVGPEKAKQPPIASSAEQTTQSTAESETLQQQFQAYVSEATSIVRRLYLRATAVGADQQLNLSTDFEHSVASSLTLDDQDEYLHQLAAFATFVVRDLSEEQQKEAKLHEAAFTLFQSDCKGQHSFYNEAQGARADVLSLGILKGLWPSTMASLADLNISPLNLLDDFDSLDKLPSRTRLVRNTIATVVTNKYSAAASVGASKVQYPGNHAAWQATVDAVKAKLDGGASLTPHRFARLVALAAGAFARLDKDSKALAKLLAFAPARHAEETSNGNDTKAAQQMARIVGGLLVSDRTLSTDDHAVVKSIYKQWVYGQTVKALLPLAFPPRKATVETEEAAVAARRASTVHTIAIMALVRGMPFSVYEDDVATSSGSESLVRVLVAAATTLVPQWGDVAVALRVLSSIVTANRADAVRSHLKTVVDASIRVFSSAGPASSTSSSASAPPPTPASRKEALLLVSQLPAHYEEGLLLPYEPRLARALAAACGDRVREIREVAQKARENWAKVAV
ncbi:DNA repair transcription protein [Sporothrix brasiliensis 5110]|uniref:MMS19 nucleotide excision repair protein n=1 Tax=Sporothrix brasiliensis 5110 TaxID=1398154 RepID=A0A0C2J2F6_9PEZI|nr:DNA repair transcription protein [Sporothrix brasiliensis 5110]KIH91262.1 DNA repair transcription protein [Sporothrix brasiliensis 5110]